MTGKPLLLLAALAIATLPPGPAGASLALAQPGPGAASHATPRAAEPRAVRLARLEGERRSLSAEAEAMRRQQASAGSPAAQARIAELEQRVADLEAEITKLRAETLRSVPGTQTPADPVGLQPVDPLGQAGQVTAGNSFNPAITVIPDGVYYNDNRDGAAPEIAEGAAGFDLHGAEAGGHGHGALERGFNLRELEVTFSGSVDPYFDAWAILAVGGGELEIEEAFVQTRKLIPGLQLKFGKFYSGVGYLNRQHPHQWDFVDQALPYEGLFGGAINEVGVQVNWLPSLPVYTLFGFEALQGENEGVSRHLGAETSPFLREAAGPRLFTGFVKVSPDIGYAGALQVGASLGYSRQHQELHAEEAEPESLEGSVTFFGLDAVYRYDSGRQWGVGDLTLQGEYFRRGKSLDVVGAGADPVTGIVREYAQDGLYLQGVYGFAPRWTAGLRFDTLGLLNRVDEGAERLEAEASRRYSASLTFNPTEFSRLRFQFTRGDFAGASERATYHQVWVQFQVSLGVHGAHRF